MHLFRENQTGPLTFASFRFVYLFIRSLPVSYDCPEIKDMKTLRQKIMVLLSDSKMNAKEISSAVGIREKEVYGHLSHIARSIKSQGRQLVIDSAECMGCGYVFEKRKRFTRPGRCPICKSEHITNPMYQIV
jgi:transcriptional regulator